MFYRAIIGKTSLIGRPLSAGANSLALDDDHHHQHNVTRGEGHGEVPERAEVRRRAADGAEPIAAGRTQ
jgi:hypothetical protein